METKHIISVVLAAVVALAIYGAYLFPQIVGIGSPAGTTFSTAKVAAINYTPSTSAASSTSLYNGDASDRLIIDNFASCNGTNGQGVTFTAATTTVSSTGLFGNSANLAVNVFATTTTVSKSFYVASSTEGFPTNTGRVWPTGTYLTYVASSTNSGICTVGVHYLAL